MRAVISKPPRMLMSEADRLCQNCKKRPVKTPKYRPTIYCEVCVPRTDAKKQRAYMDGYAVERRFQRLMAEAEQRGPYDITAKERAKLRDRFNAGVCELSGERFRRFQPGGGQRQPFAASLDRIDPKKGYVEDNCRWVLQGLNYLRNEMTDSDFRRIVALFVANSPEMLDEVRKEANRTPSPPALTST
jgi:hypothetical protein